MHSISNRFHTFFILISLVGLILLEPQGMDFAGSEDINLIQLSLAMKYFKFKMIIRYMLIIL